jgi:Asp-tRNA(Asn)/Glu-tRNA(Gln) amidotransferase A subunit family amidase
LPQGRQRWSWRSPARCAQEHAPEPDACLSRIAAVLADIAGRDLDTSADPPLNAFLTLNPNAFAQARALDRKHAAGEPKGPLFCVPVAVKDNFDTYDMPTTVGSLALLGNRPPDDAPFVQRLRAGGAVIVGKTNMDGFAMGIHGLSGAGGRVGNAYDTGKEFGRLLERVGGSGGHGLRAVRARQRQLRLVAHSGRLHRCGLAAAFHSRHGADLGALAPERFRALTQELVTSAVTGR